MANQPGERHVCAHRTAQLLVLKPRAGALERRAEPVSIEAPKPLPASD